MSHEYRLLNYSTFLVLVQFLALLLLRLSSIFNNYSTSDRWIWDGRQLRASLAVIISYPTRQSWITVLLKTPQKDQKSSKLKLLFHFELRRRLTIFVEPVWFGFTLLKIVTNLRLKNTGWRMRLTFLLRSDGYFFTAFIGLLLISKWQYHWWTVCSLEGSWAGKSGSLHFAEDLRWRN